MMCKTVPVIVLVAASLIGYISADLGFPSITSSIQEGSSSSFTFGQFGPDDSLKPGETVYCQAKIDAQSTATLGDDYTWSLDGGANIVGDKVSFQLRDAVDGGPESVEFTVQTKPDFVFDDGEIVHVHAVCYTTPEPSPFSAIFINNCNYKLIIGDTTIAEDPHFIQNVIGKNENGETVTDNICYDLTGTAGDVFELLTDDLLDVSVYCQLRDDYYMGQIRIKTPIGLFKADTNYVSFEGQFQRGWNDVEKFEMGRDPMIAVELINEAATLSYMKNNRKMAVRVERVYQSGRGKSYLNFFVEETSDQGVVFDRHHGGLFGYAANNKYQFSLPVQKDGKMVDVSINNRKVNAYHQSSPVGNSKCYLLNLDDVIAPHTKSKFMKVL